MAGNTGEKRDTRVLGAIAVWLAVAAPACSGGGVSSGSGEDATATESASTTAGTGGASATEGSSSTMATETATATATATTAGTGDPTTATETGSTGDPTTDTGDALCPVVTPNPELRFGSAGQFKIGVDPRGVAVGDLDGDGDGDIVAAAAGSSTIEVLYVDGTGRLATPVSHDVDPAPRAIAIGDMDGDGDLDVVASGVHVLINDGSGALTPKGPSINQAGVDVRELVLADLDKDGDLDVATVDGDDATVSAFRNDGSGALTSISTPVLGANEAMDLRAGDLDGDGAPELIVATHDGGPEGDLKVLPNDGLGDFGPPQAYYSVVKVEACALTDIDQDGDLDVLASGPNTFQIALLRNEGGVLGPPEKVGPVTDPFDITTADLDGDGHVELIRRGYRNIGIHEGDGFAFDFHGYAQSAFISRNVTAGFVDADDRGDLLTWSPELGIVEIFLHGDDWTFAPPDTGSFLAEALSVAAGDFEGDGDRDLVVGTGSIGDRLYTMRPGPGGAMVTEELETTSLDDLTVAVADFDGDGDVDILASGVDDLGPTLYLVNQGDGTFEWAANQIPVNTLQLVPADVDGDGDLDLVTRRTWPYLHDNLGDGTLVGSGNPIDMEGMSIDVAVGDLDLDGDLDVVNLVGPAPFAARVLFNDGASFTVGASLATAAGSARVVLADVDGDDDLDLAVATAAGVQIARNDSDGDFGPFALTPGFGQVTALGAADLDGDADVDLAIVAAGGHRIDLLVGKGDGSFAAGPTFPISEQPSALLITDIDGDCAADLVVTRLLSEAASVLFARP